MIVKDSVLVTGGLGVVGSYITAKLLEEGRHVCVIDSAEKPRNLWIEKQLKKHPQAKNLHVFTTRMESVEAQPFLQDAAQRCSLVIHAAASTGIPHSASNPSGDWAANVEATRALLEAYRFSKRSPTTVVFSSVKPYALHTLKFQLENTKYTLRPGSTGVDESYQLSPDEPYAASKMAQSAICVAYARSYDFPITILRFSNLYGPAPCHGPRHGWLTWFCISAALGIPIEIQGNGHQTRDMLYVSDIHSAVMTAAEKIEKCRGEIFNVGGGYANTISVLEAAEKLSEMSGVEIKYGPERKHEDLFFVTNTFKFQSTVGKNLGESYATWNPIVSPHQGIDAIYKWACENAAELAVLYKGP